MELKPLPKIYLHDWESLSGQEQLTRANKAMAELFQKDKLTYKMINSILKTSILKFFVRELIKVIGQGKTKYSAQSIYNFISNWSDETGSCLNLIDNSKASEILADLVMILFPSELTGFFDEQGIAA